MILVTGGAGYIGSHAVKELCKHGYEPLVLDNLSKGHLNSVMSNKFVECDLADVDAVRSVFENNKIDAVMHFAAQSLVSESMVNPLKYYDQNVGNTIKLLSIMRDYNVLKVILSSTAAVYGEPDEIPITENHPLVPTNPYGNSKLIIENILCDCDKLSGMKYISLRYFNAAGADESGLIGEYHDPETHLIPNVLKVALGQNKIVNVFGDDYDTPDGTCVRDYIHVTDLANAHILALENLLNGGSSNIFNLGNGHGYSVNDIIETAREVTGAEIPVNVEPRRDGDPSTLIASSEKIKNMLEWSPAFNDISTIIKSAWKWSKSQHYGYRSDTKII